MISKILLSNKLFYTFITLLIVAICFSNPFLRIPYDMWFHLDKLEFYMNHEYSLFEVKNKKLWYYLWSVFFSITKVEDILYKAKIIHVVQTLISFIIIYFLSNVILRNLFKNINSLTLKYLSLWSVLIWFVIYATFSMRHHHVWTLWYSINYQITLLFFWYILALTIILFTEKNSKTRILFYLFQIVIFIGIILWMHAPEFIYFAMYLFLLCIIYVKQIFKFMRIYYIPSIIFISILLLALYAFFAYDFMGRTPPLFRYLNLEHIDELYERLIYLGKIAVAYYSRSNAALNVLIYSSIFMLLLMSASILYNKFKREKLYVDVKVFILLAISSLFIFIPINTISAGVSSMLFAPLYIHRFYYASSIFIALPAVIYYLFYRKNIWVLNGIIFITLLLSAVYSKHLSSNQSYYKNIKSIKSSFSKEEVGFNLSREQIITIGERLKYYESLNKTEKKEYYYARDDIAFVIKYIYKKPLLLSRRGNLDYKKSYKDHDNKKYYPILFEVPKNFPIFQSYK